MLHTKFLLLPIAGFLHLLLPLTLLLLLLRPLLSLDPQTHLLILSPLFLLTTANIFFSLALLDGKRYVCAMNVHVNNNTEEERESEVVERNEVRFGEHLTSSFLRSASACFLFLASSCACCSSASLLSLSSSSSRSCCCSCWRCNCDERGRASYTVQCVQLTTRHTMGYKHSNSCM